MNFHFDLGLPWFLSGCVEALWALGGLIAALTAGVTGLKRIVIAWRDRATPPTVRMLCRADLLGHGLPILSLSDAKKVGQAKDVILDLASGRVAGFRAKSGPFTHRILPFDQAKAIGPDAITVASAASLLDERTPAALLALAREKYRRTDCRVLGESGTELGQLSWRDLRFDSVSGEVQIVLEVQGSSFITYLVDLVLDVVSIFQPLDSWSINPWHLAICLPLTAVLKVNGKVVIVKSQAEADFRDQQQAAVNKQHERLKNSRECFKLTLARAWRRVTGKTP
jgi:uncharacterized protein YrrD